MKSDRWKKIDELFGAALELSKEERKAFLDAACAGDPSLRGEVEKMLGFDERAANLLEEHA
ncbi:MAG TPA: hypothetical protein VE713_20375, partial [Pyrinomonadaceae bacterium]|nr:hypothetical protein [Pyrinomonadaceae bacterium]